MKPEMWHIYRQLTTLQRVRPVVIARKRENAAAFPFADVRLVPKPALHFLRRIWFKQIWRKPWTITRAETRALRRVLFEIDARLLHIYFGHIAVLLRPLLEEWEGPCLVSFHGADVLVDMERASYRRATREMLERVDGVLVRSESLRRAVIALGCAAEKIEIQRTGIPLQEFAFHARPVPSNGEWRLLQAGRFIAKKGCMTTLRAFASFRREFPQATLTFAGDGPLRAELEVATRALGLEGAVRFTGFISQPQLRELFYASHLFLHPSETAQDGNQEGVPNSILEAMATGLPIFATTHGGIPEAVERGGVLVEEGDSNGLAEALVTAARDTARLAQLGQAAAEEVAAKFDQNAQTRRLEETYLRKIKKGSMPKGQSSGVVNTGPT
ncbi:MAG: glycosyltransferase [Verrucomicrobiota bacterium]